MVPMAKRTAEDIVDAVASAARKLLLARSPSAITVREIADEAGVNLGLIHRYVGSKDDIIALVLASHKERVRATIADVPSEELIDLLAATAVEQPRTGRLLGGLLLDGVDFTELNSDYPLLDRLGEDGRGLDAALTYALVIGWELFGPSLLAATETTPTDEELIASLADSLRAIRNRQNQLPSG